MKAGDPITAEGIQALVEDKEIVESYMQLADFPEEEEKPKEIKFPPLDDESAWLSHGISLPEKESYQGRAPIRTGVYFGMSPDELQRRKDEREKKKEWGARYDLDWYRMQHELVNKSVVEGLHEFADPMSYFIRRIGSIQKQVEDLQKMMDVWPEVFNVKKIEGVKGKKRKLYDKLEDAEADGFDRIGIDRCLRGENKTHKGFRWKYVSNPW